MENNGKEKIKWIFFNNGKDKKGWEKVLTVHGCIFIPFHDVLVKNEIYFVRKDIYFVTHEYFFVIN